MIPQALVIALQGLAMVAAFTVVPGTTEHGNIRPRDIVSTNIEQSVDYIVEQKGYATTNQVNDAKDSAIDTANKYTDEQMEYIIEQVEDIQTDSYNYTDKATNATLEASKKYTDNSADTLRDADAKNLVVAFSEIIDATNAVLSSSKSYTDDKIEDITFPVESVNGKTGKVVLTASDISGISYPVTSVNGKTGDVNLTSDNISVPKNNSGNGSTNLTEYIDNQDAVILDFAIDYDSQLRDELTNSIANTATSTLNASKKYTDDSVDGLATDEYVNTKANAAMTVASQNATNYCNVFLDSLQELVDTLPDSINDGILVAISNSNAYTDKTIANIKLPITDRQGSLTNTALTEIKRTIVTDDYFSDIVSELEDSFIGFITANNNALFRDYTNKTAIASHDTLTNANAYTDKKVASVKVTETDPVFENWKDSYGIAIGNGASIETGNYSPSIAIGTNCRAKNDSIAIGYGAEAINNGSFAVGSTTYAMGDNAICFGSYAIANQDSLSVGNSINGVGKTINIGKGINNNSVGSIFITTGPQDGSQTDNDHGEYSITFNSEDSISTTFPKERRLKALYLGDYNLDELVGDKITNVTKSLDFVKTEEDPKFTAWTNETYKILLGKGATADITAKDASAIVIGSGARAGDHSIALGEAIDGGQNNISIGSSIFHSDTINNIVIGNASGNMNGEPQKLGGIVIGSMASDYFGDSIVIGYGAESHNFGSVNFGSEAMFNEYGYTNIAERLNQIWFGDENLASMIMEYVIPEFKFYQSRLKIENIKPTAIESGKFYCFRPTSTAETSITISPTFDNGREDEAKLYLDYTTARSNITIADSTITVLYAPNSYKLNAFDAPNGSSNRYLVELKWFATTATEDGTSKKFLIVDAQKVSE